MIAWEDILEKQTVQKIIAAGKNLKSTRVLIMGITFKEDVTDIFVIRRYSILSMSSMILAFRSMLSIPGAGKHEVKERISD